MVTVEFAVETEPRLIVGRTLQPKHKHVAVFLNDGGIVVLSVVVEGIELYPGGDAQCVVFQTRIERGRIGNVDVIVDAVKVEGLTDLALCLYRASYESAVIGISRGISGGPTVQFPITYEVCAESEGSLIVGRGDRIR